MPLQTFADLKILENDPRFTNLTYDAQVRLRTKAFTKVAKTDPRFLNLQTAAKDRLMRKYIFQPPKFEDPVATQVAQRMYDQFYSGNPEDQLAFKDSMKGFAGMGGFNTNLLGKVGQWVNRFTEQVGNEDHDTLILERQQQLISAQTPEEQAQIANSIKSLQESKIFSGKESNKFNSYIQLLSSQDSQQAKVYNNMTTFGKTTGFIADLALMYGNPVTGAMRTGFAALGKTLGGKMATRFGTWAVSKLAPMIAETTVEGLIGVGRDNAIKLLDGSSISDIVKEGFGTQLKSFGEWAALDYLINLGIMQAVPLARLGKQVLFNSKAVKNVFKLDPAQLTKAIDDFTSGKMPVALYDQLPDVTKDHLQAIKNSQKAAQLGVEAGPFHRTVLAGDRGYLNVLENADGTYRTRVKNSLDAPKNYANLRLAQEAVSVEVNKVAQSLAGEAADAFKQEYKWIMNYENLGKNLDETFDAFSGSFVDSNKGFDTTKKVKPNDFVSQTNRSAISFSELQQDVQRTKNAGGFAKEFPIMLEPQMKKVVENGGVIFSDISSKGLSAGDFGTDKAYISLLNPTDKATYLRATQKAEDLIKKGTKGTIQEVRSSLLIGEGFDGAVLDDIGNAVETFYPDRIKILSENINPNTGKTVNGPTIKKTKTPNVAQVSETFSTSLPLDKVVKDPQTLSLLLSKLGNNLNAKSIKNLGEAYMKNLGSSQDLVIKTSNNLDGFVFKKGNELIIPNQLLTPKAKSTFIKTLTKNLDEIAGTTGNANKISKLADKLEAKGKLGTYAPPLGKGSEQLKWASDIVKSGDGVLTSRGGEFIMTLPGKEPMIFQSLQEVTDRFVKETITPAQLKSSLAFDGQRLIKSGGTYQIREGSKVISEATSIPELLNKANMQPKLDIRYAPDIISISPTSANMTYSNSGATGSNGAIRRFLNKYADYSIMDRLTKVGETKLGSLYKDVDSTFRVTMPGYGIDEVFGSAQDARNFMNTWDSTTNLKKLSQKKGLAFNYENGQYVVREAGQTFKFNSKEDLGKFFKDSYPDPQGLKDILGATDDEVLAAQASLKGKKYIDFMEAEKPWTLVDPDGNRTLEPVSMWRGISQAWQPFGDWFYKIARDIGLPEIMPLYRGIENGQRVTKAAVNEGNKIISSLLTDSKGKLFPAEARRNIYYAIANEDPGKYNKVLKDFSLTSEHTQAIEKIKDFLGRDAQTGLFKKFGIDPKKWIENYAPRIKTWTMNNTHRVNSITQGDLLKEVFGEGGIPKGVGFWANNERASELIRMTIDDDMLSVLTKYNTQGHKKLFLDPHWKNLDNYLTANKGTIPDTMMTRLNVYREQVMGIHYSNGEMMAKEFGKKLMTNLAKGDLKAVAAGQDMISQMYALNYMTTMGWRPYLAMRNMLQPYTTLAPRFGNSVVNQAIKEVASNPAKIIADIERLGIIGSSAPTAHLGEAADTLLKELTHKSLIMFKRSDDITRAVAFQTARIQLLDAISKLDNGTLKTTEQFINYSGLNLIDEDLIPEVMKHIQAKQYDAALDIYGKTITEDTMFAYRSAQSPMAFKGLVGKLFGQYGTYSAGWRANMWKGISRGTKGQRIAYMSRYLANTLAIGGALSLIGVNGRNFLPFAPAVFTGGPMFDAAVTAIKAADFQSFKGRQARAELDRYVPLISPKNLMKGKLKFQTGAFTPFSYQVRAIQNFLDYSKKNQHYQAWLSLTSAPISPDWQ